MCKCFWAVFKWILKADGLSIYTVLARLGSWQGFFHNIDINKMLIITLTDKKTARPTTQRKQVYNNTVRHCDEVTCCCDKHTTCDELAAW